MIGSGVVRQPPERVAAEQLRVELAEHGIAADVHTGDQIALVSVWIDLVVWTDGLSSFYWWNGDKSEKSGLRRYAWGPISNPSTTARRVAGRYAQLRRAHPLSAEVAEMNGAAV